MKLWIATLLIILVSSPAMGQTIGTTCAEGWIEWTVSDGSVDETTTMADNIFALNMDHADIVVTGSDSAVSCFTFSTVTTIFQVKYVCEETHDWIAQMWINAFSASSARGIELAVHVRNNSTVVVPNERVAGSIVVAVMLGTTATQRESFSSTTNGVELANRDFISLVANRTEVSDFDIHTRSGTRLRLVSRKCPA